MKMGNKSKLKSWSSLVGRWVYSSGFGVGFRYGRFSVGGGVFGCEGRSCFLLFIGSSFV